VSHTPAEFEACRRQRTVAKHHHLSQWTPPEQPGNRPAYGRSARVQDLSRITAPATGYRFSATNWLTVNDAPAGSARTAKTGDELLEMVTVARQRPHRRADVDRGPAEHGAVESLGGLDIIGVQIVEVHRAVLVDRRRASVRSGLPDAKGSTLGVGEHTHPPRVENVERLGEHPPAGRAHPRGGSVGGVNTDVGVPHSLRRSVGWHRGDRRRVPAGDARHEVVRPRPRRHHILGLPPEQPGVEPGGIDRVGLVRVDPARHAGRVILAGAHDGRLQVCLAEQCGLR
jgi:hypothetical protein